MGQELGPGQEDWQGLVILDPPEGHMMGRLQWWHCQEKEAEQEEAAQEGSQGQGLVQVPLGQEAREGRLRSSEAAFWGMVQVQCWVKGQGKELEVWSLEAKRQEVDLEEAICLEAEPRKEFLQKNYLFRSATSSIHFEGF